PHPVCPTETTVYTVTVVDANGDTDSTTATVTVFPAAVANAGNDVAICPGGSTTLGASGGVTYAWSPGTGLSSTTIAAPTANPTQTTTYTVTVTSANGCTDTDEVTVTVNAVPLVSAGPDQDICLGNSAALSASGGVTYAWSPATGLS